MAKTPRSRRPAPRSPRAVTYTFTKPRIEALEDRSVPSTTLPLSGTTWTEIGPRDIAAQAPGERTTSPGNLASSGRANDIALHPTNPAIAYVASAGGGIWKTTDSGDTWTPLTDRLPASTPGLTDADRNLVFGSVALSTLDPNRVYAGEGDAEGGDNFGNGLLKSTDGGTTWKLIKGTRPGSTEFVSNNIAKIVVLPNPAAPTDASQELVYVLVSGGGTTNGV
jgi:hypothetical protein